MKLAFDVIFAPMAAACKLLKAKMEMPLVTRAELARAIALAVAPAPKPNPKDPAKRYVSKA
ncbi:hypothetical protein D3C87_1382200 [compost metagenome]